MGFWCSIFKGDPIVWVWVPFLFFISIGPPQVRWNQDVHPKTRSTFSFCLQVVTAVCCLGKLWMKQEVDLSTLNGWVVVSLVFFFSPVHSDVVLCVCLCGSVVRLMQAQMGGDEHCLGFYLLCLLNLTPDHLSVCFHSGPICSLLFSKHTFGHFQFRP